VKVVGGWRLAAGLWVGGLRLVAAFLDLLD